MRPAHAAALAVTMLLVIAACAAPTNNAPPTDSAPAESGAQQGEAAPEPDAGVGDEAGTGEEVGAEAFGEIIATRPPAATATPDFIAREVSERVASSRLQETSFLGLSADDWINLLVSLLIVALAFLVVPLLLRKLLGWVGRYTSAEFAEVLSDEIGPRLKWLVVIPAFYVATIRLNFLSYELKRLLADVYFVLAVVLATLIAWTLIDLGHGYYRRRFAAERSGDQLEPVLLLSVRLIRIVLVIVAASILLARFGVNFTALIAALGIGGLALSLAAQDTLADAIAGFTILIDQPYRIGDRIEIQGENTWGDVVEIGIRTTRIRTRDNRMVIVPNSIISKNQVVNYTFPDPRYRIQTHISIGYGSDIEKVRRLIVDTVRKVEGVLPDRPVDALYVEMGDSAMVFRVRWWLQSYEDTRRMLDRVNTALQVAFDAHDIVTPFPTSTTRLEMDDATAAGLTRAVRDLPSDE